MTGYKTGGWLSRLRSGLSRSSKSISDGVAKIFTNHRLDADTLGELEELLISADMGVATASQLVGSLERHRFHEEISPNQLREMLADSVASILEPVAKPLVPDPDLKPHVVLVVGVNGSGKTTTIAKLARRFTEEGRSVMLAAGDTFRAAAIEQLQVWGERTGCAVIAREQGADAAGLAFEAVEQARRQAADVLIIDSAGRLQNKANLMAELQKMVRAIRKLDAAAPHDCLLVLDATAGQNAHNQVEVFRDMVAVSGLVLTKLDGSAKGGVVVALAEKFGLPIHAVGVGESFDDMRPFEAGSFARALMGLVD